jgi:hypothetical protein
LGRRRSAAVDTEGGRVMRLLRRHGGHNRCQSREMTNAQHRATHGAVHTVKDLVCIVNDRVDMVLVTRHEEPTHSDAHDHRDVMITNCYYYYISDFLLWWMIIFNLL